MQDLNQLNEKMDTTYSPTKVILVGYPGSQFLVPASKYLIERYMPGFDVIFLNYEGDTEGWSRWIADYLKKLDDEYVIFSLDDYLISGPINKEAFEEAVNMKMDSVKLCVNTLEEHLGYPITTQYTIWKREVLIRIMELTLDPWDFEVRGSKLFRELGYESAYMNPAPMQYNTSSALSSRWPGVSFKGLSDEDVSTIKAML